MARKLRLSPSWHLKECIDRATELEALIVTLRDDEFLESPAYTLVLQLSKLAKTHRLELLELQSTEGAHGTS